MLLLRLALLAGPALAASGTVWATPHDSYSSSVGVLGCFINTNRVAYWPDSVSCSNICVALSHAGRTVHLLRVDQSQGAHDISYDAWNYLITGESATKDPVSGGAVSMTYQDVDAAQCAHLINTKDAKLPLSASNSMNFLAECLGDDNSYVAQNHVLYNILDATCQYGYDEVCSLTDFPAQNQPNCTHQLGVPRVLTTLPVWNIMYPTGEKVRVGTVGNASYTAGAPVPTSSSPVSSSHGGGDDDDDDEEDAAVGVRPVLWAVIGAVAAATMLQ
ncbi:hypothetical protein TD95_000726 [Thielaviopsis punctulata]|uniref:Cerato-platanin n=1 Tax=Thielaviopsis punctulata TaxID=72032 RepID=A0A0F4ZKW6_9PEZI|nr:hypothetical protein TD95_000726 [Thielaviopsis punctulata]